MKPRGNCVFCGSEDLSGEHIWPKWAAQILGSREDKSRRVEGFRVHTEKTRLVSEEMNERHGHIAHKKVFVVCQKCNNTWMSELENETKDIALPLMQGKEINLTPDMQHSLAKWVFLKTLVAENNRPDEAIFTQATRDSFRGAQEIPSSIRIWIGHCTGDVWRNAYLRHTALLGLSLDKVPNGGKRNTQSVALGIGELFFISVGCVSEEVDLTKFVDFDDRLLQIWPLSGRDIKWPPNKTLSNDNASKVAGALELLIRDSRTKWKEIY